MIRERANSDLGVREWLRGTTNTAHRIFDAESVEFVNVEIHPFKAYLCSRGTGAEKLLLGYLNKFINE